MTACTIYQEAVLKAHPDAQWALDRFPEGKDRRDAIEQAILGDPYMQKAVELVAGCETPDDASEKLSAYADELEREAVASRGEASWEGKALAMGRIRTAAANVWQADSEQRFMAR